jgi:hypothetical protein
MKKANENRFFMAQVHHGLGEIGSNGGRAELTKNLFGTDVLCGARSKRTALNHFWWTCRAINEGDWIWIR